MWAGGQGVNARRPIKMSWRTAVATASSLTRKLCHASEAADAGSASESNQR